VPKRSPTKEPRATTSLRREKARVAFDRVVEDIHEDHRELEGEELYRAVLEVFFDLDLTAQGEKDP